ncbi:MAG TPA: chloride channel protein [Acidimicrobiales bacterium]|jgi:H+/Cl- antiporter ClcA|nr:chloride channel protein [Acidimicrobiales bacterium]
MADMSNPLELLKSRSYLFVLALAAAIGVPISALAYFFLELVSYTQHKVYVDLPHGLGFHTVPLWWPVPLLAVSGVLVALAIKYLPGTGGHSPAEGFKVGAGGPTPIELPGIVLAALATLMLGVVLGPEAPLIAIGGGLGVCAVRLAKRDAPPMVTTVLAGAGSFAAISTLFGSPLLGAFLLMEASGLGGPVMGLVLVPGLLSAGIGYLVFVGLNSWTGFGTFTLAIPHLPHFPSPDIAEFGWAFVIGLAAVLLGGAVRWFALFAQSHVEKRRILLTPVAGLAVAGMAILFEAGSGKGTAVVLFSGQTALGPVVQHAAGWSVAALVLLVACKGVAYSVSLSSFRGGPIFPALFIGAVGGLALSHLPGLPMVPAVAMGIGALCVVMLKLPLTSVLLASLLTQSAGGASIPLVIVAVTVAYVATAYFSPVPRDGDAPVPTPPASTSPAPTPPTASDPVSP